MEDLKITKDIAIRCVLFGACKIPKVGRLFNSFSTSDLIWAERIFVKKELAKFKTPLWLCSGDGGYGYGDGGYGDGGYGDGDGYGGYGYGDGGYGSGDGGYGDGDGYGGYGYGGGGGGYGYGGYGYGDGYGGGDGDGDGVIEKILKVA